jgi:hypothetical protein
MTLDSIKQDLGKEATCQRNSSHRIDSDALPMILVHMVESANEHQFNSVIVLLIETFSIHS